VYINTLDFLGPTILVIPALLTKSYIDINI
jgi:hypothetical protein